MRFVSDDVKKLTSDEWDGEDGGFGGRWHTPNREYTLIMKQLYHTNYALAHLEASAGHHYGQLGSVPDTVAVYPMFFLATLTHVPLFLVTDIMIELRGIPELGQHVKVCRSLQRLSKAYGGHKPFCEHDWKTWFTDRPALVLWTSLFEGNEYAPVCVVNEKKALRRMRKYGRRARKVRYR